MKPVGVILAGGRSSRMGGGDKGLLPLNGASMLDHVLAAITPQVESVLINSNSNPAPFARYGVPVLADHLPGHLGPLAGVLTGMIWATRAHPHATHLLSVPCDTPFLPGDLAARLATALSTGTADIAIARDAERQHPTLGLWPIRLAEQLADDLQHGGVRAMQAWLAQFAVTEIQFETVHLQNINTPADLAAIAARATTLHSPIFEETL